MGSEDGDRGRRDAWNPRGVPQRIRSHLGQTLNDFTRQAGNAFESEAVGNAATFVAAKTIDLGLLPFQVAGVLHCRLQARSVQTARPPGDLEIETSVHDLLKADLRLAEQLRGRDTRRCG